MKRHNFALQRAQEELCGARQCIVCLVALSILSMIAALGCYMGVMTTWMLIVWLVGAVTLSLGSLWFCCRAEYLERKADRDRLHSDYGSYVDP